MIIIAVVIPIATIAIKPKIISIISFAIIINPPISYWFYEGYCVLDINHAITSKDVNTIIACQW